MAYVKHHSFQSFHSNIAADIADQTSRAVRLVAPLTETNSILRRAVTDLRNDAPSPTFRITQFIADEMSRLTDSEIPRYLCHRYRYDVFPQTHELDNYPPYLQIEPSSLCNYRCVFCYQKDRTFFKPKSPQMGFMSLELFKHIIDDADGNIDFISLASRGEPLLCPDLPQMLTYCRGKFLGLKINTNASLLTEDICHAILSGGVNCLVFSVDAPKEPQYSRYRAGGNLADVTDRIRLFHSIRREHYPDSPIIVRVSGVLFNPAEQDIREMVEFWGQYVDQVSWVAYNPWENIYDAEASNVSVPCSDLWRRLFIWCDGTINPCDSDYRSTLKVGKLSEQNISAIWTGASYDQIRKTHLKNHRSTMNPCSSCQVK
jgi:radical SAM protein with 4Fe4S-binding SPASM domain